MSCKHKKCFYVFIGTEWQKTEKGKRLVYRYLCNICNHTWTQRHKLW